MTQIVSSSLVIRFTQGQTCPVCTGSEDDARGKGTRCHGFRTGFSVFCSREEHGGGCQFHARSGTYRHRSSGSCSCGAEHAIPDAGCRSSNRPQVDHVYRYRDEEGNVLFEVVRFRNPKGFRQSKSNQRHPWNIDGVRRVLYNLPALRAADGSRPVWIVEGEKDADRLGREGLLSTCNAMGAGKWHDHYAASLIIADNDDPGWAHARQVAQALLGEAASVKAAWCDFLEKHARRVYQADGDSDPEAARQLGHRLRTQLSSPFKVRDVVRKGWMGLSCTEDVERAVSILEGHGWLVRVETGMPITGRPPTDEFHINPALRERSQE